MRDFVIEIDELNKATFLLNDVECEKISSSEGLYYYGCILNRKDLREIVLKNLEKKQSISTGLKGYFTLIYTTEPGRIEIAQKTKNMADLL